VTVFFHAIIRPQSIGHGPNRMGSIAIYRDAKEDDGAGPIAEPVTRIRLQPGQDPEVSMSMNGWETCGRPTKRGGMVVVPVQPAEWSAPISTVLSGSSAEASLAAEPSPPHRPANPPGHRVGARSLGER
jgi:hypothetical protein